MLNFGVLFQDLLALYDVVRSVNSTEINMAAEDRESSMQPPSDKIDFSQLKKGDIMSNLMRMEQDNMLSSRQAHTMQDILKAAASNVKIM